MKASDIPQLEPVRFWSAIWDYAKPYRFRLLTGSFFVLLTGIGVAAQPVMIKFIVDQGILRPGASPGDRFFYASVFAVSYFLLGIFRMVTWRTGFKAFVPAIEGVTFRIRSQFFRHVQGLCFKFHDRVSSGELFNYIMGAPVNSIKDFFRQFVMFVPHQMVSWVLGVIALFTFDWVMTLILIFTALMMLAVNRRSQRTMRGLTKDYMETESRVSKYVADALRGTREIKIHAIEDSVSEAFDSQIRSIREQSQNLTLRQQIESFKPETLQYIGITFVYCAGAYSCIFRELSVGSFFAFINSMNLLLGPLVALAQLGLVKANAEAGLERIVRILDTEPSVAEVNPGEQLTFDVEDSRARSAHEPLIEFRNVTFAYDNDPVLKNVSCTIMHGESVALVGQSGSGKTTFAKLVLRLYDPQSGAVLINGRNIKSYSLKELRSQFGVVSQDAFLFQTTIAENIRAAEPAASDADLRKAMEMAFVTEFVDELPDKADTEVGENGYALSGGQKQRVAIARAILGNNRHFIFDEATSALDNQSERRIQDAMAQLQHEHTMLIIAHRLSTVKSANKILVFDKGAIVQAGTYAELADRPGRFQDLLRHGL